MRDKLSHAALFVAVILSLTSASNAAADASSPEKKAGQATGLDGCARPITKKRLPVTPSAAPTEESIEQTISGTQHLVLNCATPSARSPEEKLDNTLSTWLDFLRHLVEALAWPIVAVVIAWRLGPEIRRKLPLLRRLEAGPLKAEFDEEVAAVRKEAEEQFPKTQTDTNLSTEEARLLQIAKVSPRAAIAEAWRFVEVAATKAVEQRLDEKFPPRTTLRTARSKSLVALSRDLASLELLAPQQLSVFHELRNLRNQAAHSEEFEMDFESANNYIQSALALTSAIQNRGATAR